MLSKHDFQLLLGAQNALIIDGALATELEVRGHDLNHALWSAKILRDDPSSIQQVHLDYYLAGADIAITASYQVSREGLQDHCGMDDSSAKDLVVRSVVLACNAREHAYENGIHRSRRLLVAGSVGPYGAYLADGSEYRGDYLKTATEFSNFHRPRIQALLDAGVDLLALETMPSVAEIEALLMLLRDEFPSAVAWLSCTTASSEALSDGTPWSVVLELVHRFPDQVLAFGINCVSLTSATDTLISVRKFTQLPLVCYPNSGESWDAATKTWHRHTFDNDVKQSSTQDPQRIPEVQAWYDSGARLVGGCCRTGPAFIRAVHNTFHQRLAV